MANAFSFWEACRGELVGVYFEDGEEGMCVVVGLVPVWWGVLGEG